MAVKLSEIEHFQSTVRLQLSIIIRRNKVVDLLQLDPLLALIVGHHRPLILVRVTVIG